MAGVEPGVQPVGVPDGNRPVDGGELVQAGAEAPPAPGGGGHGELAPAALTAAGRKLSERQRCFLWEYARTGNGAAAARAIEAMPSNPSLYGVRLLKQKRAQEELAAIRASMRSEKVVDGIEMREALSEIIRTGKPFERIAAADTLAKLDGMYPKPDRDEGSETRIVQILQLGPL